MVNVDAIKEARDRIESYIYYSPCARSEILSELCGCELYLKLENLQMTGSFKVRGAMNKLLSLSDDERQAGVVAASAGNHAQGVAHAARLLGVKATIVMPETTPLSKIRGTQELGAEIVLYGGGFEDAYGKACELQKKHGYYLIHAFNDETVIAGQGTIGLELMEQVPDVDMIVVPVGGGGLISGIATAIKDLNESVRVVGVESERMAAMKQSVETGVVVPLPVMNTIADGISIAKVGELTLPLVQRLVSGIYTVSEEELAAAIMILLEREKTLAEGAGAAGFAALLHHHVPDIDGKKVVVVISGGNIDMTRLAHILERGLEKDGRLAQIKVVMPDKPSSIAELTALIAEMQANIEHISQNRSALEVALEETEIALILQTKGKEHSYQIIKTLREKGFNVKHA